MKDWIVAKKDNLLNKYRSVIRKKAIEQAKVEIIRAGKPIDDYTDEQLEVIVRDQEEKIKQKYRKYPLIVLLIVLGIH